MSVTISINLDADHDLSLEDVFPDGVPEGEITAEMIRDMILEEYASPTSFARDWNLDFSVGVTVLKTDPKANHGYTSDHATVWQ